MRLSRFIFSTENITEQAINLTAYPNPFSTETTLQIDLGQEVLDKEIHVQVYNLSGQLMKNLPLHAYDIKNQQIQLSWDARNEQGETVDNGTYFFVVRIGDLTKAVKVMYFKL